MCSFANSEGDNPLFVEYGNILHEFFEACLQAICKYGKLQITRLSQNLE